MERLLMGFSWFFAMLGVFHHRSFGDEKPLRESVTAYGKAQIESD